MTPNKKAYSSSLELYNQILASSNEGGAKIFYESTVGAGLPIISTLKDLIQTGDKVRSTKKKPINQPVSHYIDHR